MLKNRVRTSDVTYRLPSLFDNNYGNIAYFRRISHITALAPQMPKKHAFLQVSLTTPSQSDVSPLFSKRARWEECRGGRRARDSEPPSFAKGFPALSQSPDS